MTWFALRRAGTMLVGAGVMALIAFFGVGVALGGGGTGQTDVTIYSLNADYQVARDGDGTAMQVNETIVASFPELGDHHGIDRILPLTYRGRATTVSDISVLLDGEPVPVKTTKQATAIRLQIGNQNPVKGLHTYRISYRYTGVVLPSGLSQQFSWEVTGTHWPQPIFAVSASVTFAPDLAADLTGSARCFASGFRSDPCEITRADNADGSVTFTTATTALDAEQTQTVNIGLASGTASPPPLASGVGAWLVITLGITGGLAVPTLIALYFAATRRRRAMGYDPGVVQFTPRDDLPPVLAAALVGTPGRGVIAELLRAASEGHVRLARGGSTGAPLTATLVGWPTDWASESQLTLEAVMQSRKAGSKVYLADRIPALSASQAAELRDLAPNKGLISHPSTRVSVGLIWAAVLAAPTVIVLGRVTALPNWWIVTPTIIILAALATAYGLAMRWQRLTVAGKAAYRYLNGLRMFLAASEAERITIVQGEDTSERVGPEQLVPILERLLPYAVALGVEDSWQRAIGTDLELEVDWLPSSDLSGGGPDLASTWAHGNPQQGGVIGDWGSALGDSFSTAIGKSSRAGTGGQ